MKEKRLTSRRYDMPRFLVAVFLAALLLTAGGCGSGSQDVSPTTGGGGPGTGSGSVTVTVAVSSVVSFDNIDFSITYPKTNATSVSYVSGSEALTGVASGGTSLMAVNDTGTSLRVGIARTTVITGPGNLFSVRFNVSTGTPVSGDFPITLNLAEDSSSGTTTDVSGSVTITVTVTTN